MNEWMSCHYRNDNMLNVIEHTTIKIIMYKEIKELWLELPEGIWSVSVCIVIVYYVHSLSMVLQIQTTQKQWKKKENVFIEFMYDDVR